MAKIVMSHKYIAVAEPLYDLIISDLQVIGLRQKCVSACEFFNPIFDPDEPQLVLDTFPRVSASDPSNGLRAVVDKSCIWATRYILGIKPSRCFT